MKPDLHDIIAALQAAWAADTAYNPDEWNENNRARGQCVVSSLVLQDYLGGDLLRYSVSGEGIQETHYVNELDSGAVIDTTASQYKQPVTMRVKPVQLKGFASIREKRLADNSTRRRYELLKRRVNGVLSTSYNDAAI